MEYVMQVWSPEGIWTGELNNTVPANTTTALLGFNEPNYLYESDLPAKEACKIWPALVNYSSYFGLRLGSPAVGYCDPSWTSSNCWQNETAWLDEFFDHCGLDSVDFIATHR